MKRCAPGSHDIIKADVDLFKASTTGGQSWAGIYTAECRECHSTLALRLCLMCDEPCDTRDELPWGKPEDERVCHFGCAAKVVLARNRGRKFVVLVGRGTGSSLRKANT